MLNKVILIGKIGVEPELKYFKNNTTITIINLITTEIIKNIKQSNWHRIIINNKNRTLRMGMIIMVIGKIKTRRWMEKNKYNYITEIIAEEIKIINYPGGFPNKIIENDEIVKENILETEYQNIENNFEKDNICQEEEEEEEREDEGDWEEGEEEEFMNNEECIGSETDIEKEEEEEEEENTENKNGEKKNKKKIEEKNINKKIEKNNLKNRNKYYYDEESENAINN